MRGRQSAAILVVNAEATGQPLRDRLADLHVEDHPEPPAELRRLLVLQTACEYMNRGDHALERTDFDAAMQDCGRPRALSPASLGIPFRRALSLLNAGRTPAAHAGTGRHFQR